MTKRITHRPHMKTGRKPTSPPASAPDLIRGLAADGFSIIGIARAHGVSPKTFRRWLDEDSALQDAFDQGREMERHTLHNLLFRQATEQGNIVAAMFLLKARHGYREGDQSDASNRVNVTIALPGAMSLHQFNSITTEGAEQ